VADAVTRLHALALVAIEQATQRLANGGSVDAWEREMGRIIAREHTAALIAGTAARVGVPVSDGLFKGLSRAERNELNVTVKAQLNYLTRFADDVRSGELSPAQIAARADLYGGPLRSTYYRNRYIGLPFYPTEGSECQANCKCSWTPRDDGYYWTLGTAEHCGTCESRAAGNPYQVSV
jgi:hypothetical protein